jgi:FRG domain
MSEFDLDAFLKSVHGRPRPTTVRFDKEKFSRLLKAPFTERLLGYTRPGRSVLLVYSGSLDLVRIARGIAVASTQPARVFTLTSDALRRGEAGVLLKPLTTGHTVVLVHDRPSEFSADLAQYWPGFADNPRGYVASIAGQLTLASNIALDRPGAVVVLQAAFPETALKNLDPWPLAENDAADLAALAEKYDAPIQALGRPARTDWRDVEDSQQAFRLYRALVETICKAGHTRSTAESLVDPVLRGRQPHELEADFVGNGVDVGLLDEMLDSLRALARHGGTLHGGSHENDPLPDVYAAALSMRSRAWEAAPEGSVVYRGQRNAAWDVVPSYFRPGPNGAPADVAARGRRLAAFVRVLQDAHPDLSESQCVAAAQHVSSEAGTPTWFVDVTWEPQVALFFASLGGQPGDIGVVDQIVMADWARHVAGRGDLPGGLLTIDVPTIERLRRQRGLFLNAPRADLYSRFFPNRIWFHQVEGLVFSDPTADPPFTEDWLLPAEPMLDPVVARLGRGAVLDVGESVLAAPPADPRTPLTADTLRRALAGREDVAELDGFHRRVLDVACELYARPEEWSSDGNAMKHSLMRLDEVVLRLIGRQRTGGRCDLESAVEWSKTRLTGEEFDAMLERGRLIWRERYSS